VGIARSAYLPANPTAAIPRPANIAVLAYNNTNS